MKDATGTGMSGGVRASIAHESAAQHVRGCAWYTDDIPVPAGTLYAALGSVSYTHLTLPTICSV